MFDQNQRPCFPSDLLTILSLDVLGLKFLCLFFPCVKGPIYVLNCEAADPECATREGGSD